MTSEVKKEIEEFEKLIKIINEEIDDLKKTRTSDEILELILPYVD